MVETTMQGFINPVKEVPPPTQEKPSMQGFIEPESFRIDDRDMYLYDGDTLIDRNDPNHRIRVPGYDAPEVTKVTGEGAFKLGEYAGDVTTREINKIIRELGFNKTVSTGEKDKYGRLLNDLVNDEGIKLSDYLHAERVVTANRWMSKEQEALRHFGSFADSVNDMSKNLSAGDKARAIVEKMTSGMEDDFIDLFGTRDQVYNGASNLETKFYQSEINRLNKIIEKTENPEIKRELEEELILNKEALTFSINAKPDALYMRNAYNASNNKGGFWGEMWNAAGKSYYMLENTAAGFTQWAGDAFNNETVENWGSEWVTETERDLMKAGYTTDMWSVKNPLDAGRFVASTVVQYGPQLGLIYGSAKAGAAAGFLVGGPVGSAVGGFVGGTGSALVMAISSVYQGMPEGEKDPLIALGISVPIALVDRLGMTKVLPEGTNILTKEGRDIVADGIRETYEAAGKKITREEIDTIMNKSTAEMLKEAGLDIQQAAMKQILAKRTFKDLVVELSKRSGAEGATEAIQEVIQEVGIAGTTSKELNYEDLLYTALESGTIGAIVGGTFATPGVMSEHNRLNQVFFNITQESPEKRMRESKLEEAVAKKAADERGRGEPRFKESDESISFKYKQSRSNKKSFTSLSKDANKAPNTTRWSDLVGLIKNPRRAVEAYRNFANDLVFNRDGSFNYKMADFASLIGGLRLYTGLSVPQDQKRLVSSLFSVIPSKQEIIEKMGVKDIKEVFPLLEKVGTPREGEIDPTIREEVKAFKKNLVALGGLIADQIETRMIEKDIDISIDELRDGSYFVNKSVIDPTTLDTRFKMLLRDSPGYLGSTVSSNPGGMIKFTDEMIDDIYTRLERGYISTEDRMKLQDAGVFDSPLFSQYLSSDIFDNALYFTDNLSKDIALTSKFGRNGEVLSEILDQAEKAGEITALQRAEMAKMSLDLIDMIKGKYKPIRNKKWKWIQDRVLFVSTLTYMDSNFFANMAEQVNGTIGLDRKQLYSYIKDTARLFFKGVSADIKAGTSKVTGGRAGSAVPKRRLSDLGMQRIAATGLTGGPKGDIAYLEGAETNSKFYNTLLNVFYKVNQVENQTLAMRGARAGVAWDSMLKMVDLVRQDSELGYTTEAGRWARDRLNYYRVDADRLIQIVNNMEKNKVSLDEKAILDESGLEQALGAADAADLYENYINGVINFTDEFAVRPEPGSTPKWIEDPQLRLFSQFKRFISHFTANVIPQAWKMYIRRGPPGMTYGTFSIIMGAYGMAMFSQMMKDYIVYGEKAPWLEDDEEEPYWLRTSYWRAAEYSGWMGTPAMLIQGISDYNRNASRMNPLENLYDSIVSQSPAANLINDEVLKGTEDLPDRIAKRTPFVGDIKPAREAWGKALGSKE